MSQIFISHVEEDASFALNLAHHLTKAGYSNWCYEVDSIPGRSHLDQTYEAIENADAFVLVISSICAESHEVTTELTRAQDKGKPVFPLLLGITHEELMTKTKWGQRLGPVACLSVSGEITRLMPRLTRGFASAGIEQGPDSTDTIDRLQLIDQELRHCAALNSAEIARELPAERDQEYKEDQTADLKDKRGKVFRFPGHAANLPRVGSLVKGLLDSEALETQIVQDGAGRVIQARKHSDGNWRKYANRALGLDRALTVRLTAKGNTLEMVVGDAVWVDKAVAGTVSLVVVVLWPLAVTAGWGAYKQHQLRSLIQRNVEGFLADCA
jgi:hypothetical protein